MPAASLAASLLPVESVVFLSVLRATRRRVLTKTATQSVLGAVTATGLALTLGATPAAASHPRHKASHETAHRRHASAHHTSGHTTASGHSAKHGHASRHSKHEVAKHRAANHAHRRHRADTDDARVVAEQPAAPLAIPQFALPDLAISAATFTAGDGLAGPSRTTMIPAASASRTLAALTHSAGSLLDALVTRARSQLGTRYVFGGANPGAALDCSSFARYAMEALGVRLPRTANQQAQIGRAIPRDVNILRPGDLLTFGSGRHVSHVGIYLGQGRFIHASVSHGQVIETTIDHNRSLFRRWQGARRLLAATADSADETGTTGG